MSASAAHDGSGTVSVIELASVLATLKQRPRRSIVFVTFFGEERGLLGSRYYGRHPAVPIEKTVADVNLEQVGRTDSTEGPLFKRRAARRASKSTSTNRTATHFSAAAITRRWPTAVCQLIRSA
jgi:Zn-dependent M28 family amino/carboxypeptidase